MIEFRRNLREIVEASMAAPTPDFEARVQAALREPGGGERREWRMASAIAAIIAIAVTAGMLLTQRPAPVRPRPDSAAPPGATFRSMVETDFVDLQQGLTGPACAAFFTNADVARPAACDAELEAAGQTARTFIGDLDGHPAPAGLEGPAGDLRSALEDEARRIDAARAVVTGGASTNQIRSAIAGVEGVQAGAVAEAVMGISCYPAPARAGMSTLRGVAVAWECARP